MALNKQQIKFIEKNRKKFSSEKISKELNIPLEDVSKYIDSNHQQKPPLYFYMVLLFIPILFFVFLELGLQLFGYGTDTSMWVSPSEGYLMLNPDVAKRYFSTVKNVPSSIEDVFDTEKKPNAFRVFVLGESSAAGYPYMPMGSFSRYIRKRLELTYPENRIEVINIGLTAVNSYTVRDFMPGVLEQKPDLILIYTGHNEYYGALGVGSLESMGSSRLLVNLILNLNKFKTTQLLRNIMEWFGKLFAGDEKEKSGTLMSRMAREQAIPFDSDNYKAGIDQFTGNMADVIEMAKGANVPVILGTLASNLKDQKPFISVKSGKYQQASKIFIDAQESYNSGNYKNADSLFRLAKDLDALRFRAPEEINRAIKNFGREFNLPIVDIDSIFSSVSPNGIVGDNLMTDHLHPTLPGYQLMGKIFFEKMHEVNYLPKNSNESIQFEKQDEVTRAQFPFSPIDSTIALYRIKLLKNDWPYTDAKNKVPENKLIAPKTFEDTLAYKCVAKGFSWADAHQKAVNKYLNEKNLDGFLEELSVLINQYPIVVEYYNHLDEIALGLLKAKEFDKAYKVFYKRYQLQPNDLSTKWLGTIDLNSSKIPSAIKYLEESIKLNSSDLQTMYNLAGAYALNKDYQKSFDVISRVLSSDPNYPGGVGLLQQLKGLLKQ